MGADGYFKRVNPAFTRTLGYSESELLAKPVIEFLHPEDRSRTAAGIRILQTGQPRVGSRNRYLCKDGKYRWFSWNTTPLGENFYTIGRDITEQVASEQQIQELNRSLSDTNLRLEKLVEERVAELRQSEDQVLQLQKMDAIGRLAGGVAHDFNNMLAAVMFSCDLMVDDAHDAQAVLGHVQEIREISERAAALTRQLLIFSRKQFVQPEPIDLNALIANLEKMLVRLIGENIRIVMKLAPALGLVSGDPSQMEQIFLNLVVNARDAMPAGGKITIETNNIELDETFISKHLSVSKGSYVVVSVTDEGMGMDQETVAKIFEPFFSTKPAGKGTGLGLTTAYGIVKQSKGTIWVYSEPGQGTVFKIYLPVAQQMYTARKTTAVAAPLASGASNQTILLVEDDKSLRTIFSAMLQKKGYQVLVAANAAEALGFCRNREQEIHLLLTDVIMPDLNGFELTKQARVLQPGLRVLYISGYTDDALESSGIDDLESLHFLQKPFTMAVLTAKIEGILH